MSRAVRHALGAPVAAPPPQIARVPAAIPAARRPSPLPWILAAIAAVLVLIIGGLIVAFLGRGSAPTPPAQTPQTIAAETSETTPAAAVPQTAEPSAAPAVTESAPPPGNSPIPAADTATPAPTDTAVPPSPLPATPMTGRLAFSSNRHGRPEIYVLDLAGGTMLRITNNSADDWLPDWSPDGNRLSFTSARTGSYDLWVSRADGSGQELWVGTGAWDEYARWAPDGQRLSFSSTARTDGVANSEIFVRQANGSLVRVTNSTAENQWADWSPDGRLIYTEGYQADSDWDIYIVNADGSGRTTWLDESSCDVQPTWSPDGQWIAFLRISADTNGNGAIDFQDAGDIWIGRAAGGGLRQLTRNMWATTPSWSPDGRWIAFARLLDSNGNGASDATDDADILAIPFEGGDVATLVSGPTRDGDPSWTR